MPEEINDTLYQVVSAISAQPEGAIPNHGPIHEEMSNATDWLPNHG